MRICELKQKKWSISIPAAVLAALLMWNSAVKPHVWKPWSCRNRGNFAGVFPKKMNIPFHGTASARSAKISSLLISVMKNCCPENKYLLIVKALYFYIFPEKVYFNRPLRIILMYWQDKEDSKMALNKVEICGVNTSTLPFSIRKKRRSSLKESKLAMKKPGNCTSKAICGLF